MDGSTDMSKAISLPFSFDTEGRVSNTTDLSKIIQDRVVLAIMTITGERVMRPNFGTYVRRAVFENIGEAVTLVEQEISTGFSNQFPYLHLINVTSAVDVDNYLNITVNYKYGSSANVETVTVKTATLTQSGSVITEVPYGQQ
jgi:phage baseplate assembly protein W